MYQTMGETIGEDGNTLEYVAIIDGATTFVREQPDELATIATLPGGLELFRTHARAGRYRLIDGRVLGDGPLIRMRVDVESGEVVTYDPELPQGWSIFDDCGLGRLQIDSEGRLYYELTNGGSARIWTYDIDKESW